MKLKEKRKIQIQPVKTDNTTNVAPPPVLKISSHSMLNDFEEKELIGSGSQSNVYRVVNKNTGENFALKKIRWQGSTDLQKIVNDITYLNVLRHPNIVRIYQSFYVDERVQILMSYIDGQSLEDYLMFTSQMPEPALGRLVYCVLQGLSYLRRNYFLHRDLKPSNILISKNAEVKIADFGMARQLAASIEQAQSYIGTISYMAPERIENRSYSFKSDIWSLGMIVYQCALGKFPYPGDIDNITYWDLKAYLQNDIQIKLPEGYSRECYDFISSCLKIDQSKRAAVEDLVKNPWVTKFSDDNANRPLLEWVLNNEKKRESQVQSLNTMKV